ncbi:MAG: glycosyltransferase [Chloroflexi bacterium]|nr:glycosyltransferase [Chloroflexota bacterium]
MTSFTPRISVVTSLYHGYRYLAPFLENLWEQSCFPDMELVLVHNEPEPEEEALVSGFKMDYPLQVQHLVVADVETLGASWNRASAAARGEYIAIWNVDDRRPTDSLARQVQALAAYPAAVLCYGDYIEVGVYGQEEGRRRATPPYSPGYFRRSFPQGGAFWLFRKNLLERAGPFDEQFSVGPDMELSLRIAALGLKMLRVDGVVGYFTNEGKGLSTRQGAEPSAVERTAIQLRYAIYDKVHPEYQEEAYLYRQTEILKGGEWQPLSAWWPGAARYRSLRRPLWVLGWLRNAFRTALDALGLLERLHDWQARVLKRDL